MSKKREEIEQEEVEIDREAMLDELFNDKGYGGRNEEKPKKKKKKAKAGADGSDEETITSDTDGSNEKTMTSETDEPDEETKTSETGGENSGTEEALSEKGAEKAAKKAAKKAKKAAKKEKKKKKNEEVNIVKDLLNLLVYILVVILICWAVLTYVGQRTEVSGDSMNDTLNDGDSLWIDKLTYRFDDPERYDIIVFPYSDDTYYIKRIIGLPGETVYIDEGGVIYINDEPLDDDIYGKEVIDSTKRGVASEPVTLGDDEYFVMGDNRNNSRDSRIADVGNIKLDQIEGRAVFRFSGGFGKIE